MHIIQYTVVPTLQEYLWMQVHAHVINFISIIKILQRMEQINDFHPEDLHHMYTCSFSLGATQFQYPASCFALIEKKTLSLHLCYIL